MSENEDRQSARYLRVCAYALIILASLAITWLMNSMAVVFKPLLLALFLCYVIYPAVRFLARRGAPGWLAYSVPVLGVAGVMYVIAKLISINIERFSERMGLYSENIAAIEAKLTQLGTMFGAAEGDDVSLLDAIPTEAISGFVTGGTTFVLGIAASVFVITFFMVFIFWEAGRVETRIRLAWGGDRAARMLSVTRVLNDDVQRYINLKVLVSGVTGVLAAVVMFAFGLEFWAVLALLIFLFNFIPYVGSIVATVLPGVVALLQFSEMWKVALIVAILTTIQQVLGNVWEPKLQGRNLNLSPLLILACLAFWGWLWGVVGMVIAVPLTAAIRLALEGHPATRPLAVLMMDVNPDDKEVAWGWEL